MYIQFPNKEDLFRLQRKKERAKNSNYMHGRLVRKIISIDKLREKKNTICIIVNNPNRLFITKGYLVTHNTDALLMDFARGVGRGYGADWRGLLLREATTELGDVIAKSEKWFPKMFPGAKFNAHRKIWRFPGGETLWFNYARVIQDYDQYHGHEYPWIGWEELTNHAVPDIYLKLMSCNRSSNPRIVPRYRSTCNPSGPGHAWVKMRFIESVKQGRILKEYIDIEYEDKLTGRMVKQKVLVTRTHIYADMMDNKALVNADPLYRAKMMQMTQDDDMLRKAWIFGSWDLVIGGFFTDVWRPKIHILPYFKIPKSWKCYRSFDWGSSKPWCVTFAVETNGEQPESILGLEKLPYIPKDSIIVITEIYGWNGKPNQGDGADSVTIAKRIKEVEEAIKIEYGLKVEAGPADTGIWEVRDGKSIALEMGKWPNSIYWTRAHKGPNSRATGWSLMRQMLGSAKRGDLENPHLYFLQQATHHIRTLPIMQRDEKKPEDIDCFIAGTIVDTLFGKVPIECIKIGDMVRTPIGYRKVIKSGISGKSPTFKVNLSNGESLQGTPDHKVFIENIGLVPLCKLKVGDILCENELDITGESNSPVEMDHILNAIQTIVSFLMEQHYCTEQYGKTILEKFQKDMKSITKTETNITMIFQILNAFVAKITQDYTCKKDLNVVGIYTKDLNNGENQEKVRNICKKMLEKCIKILPKGNVRAFIVVNLLLQNIQQRNSVQLNAEMQFQEKSLKNVPSVGNFFGQKDIKQKRYKPVVIDVVGNCEEQIVYNLTTEQAHMYYANGYLVSNTDLEDHCMDSLRYMLGRKSMQLTRGKVGT